MSSFEPKRRRERKLDITAWVLGTMIVVLATVDLLVWASMSNVPNPISKFVTEHASMFSVPAVRHASR
jgi:hypothetical protein